MRHLNVMLLAEEIPNEEEEVNSVSEAEEMESGFLIDASLHVISHQLSRKTIVLQGHLGGEPVNVLVDTGSTNSYIHPKHVQRLSLKQTSISPFSVMLANGTTVTSHSLCPKVEWDIQGSKFCYSLKNMDIGIWDIILGVDWMEHYSPIIFDFHQMSIQVIQEGERLLLQG